MPADIFKLFKKSIEKVGVKNTPRGTMTPEAPSFNVELDAIVKRRNSMAEAVASSEDRNSATTVHFKASDAQYIQVGNYVKIDGLWRTIEQVNDGKDLDQGVSKFVLATVGDDIVEGDDPNWNGAISV